MRCDQSISASSPYSTNRYCYRLAACHGVVRAVDDGLQGVLPGPEGPPGRVVRALHHGEHRAVHEQRHRRIERQQAGARPCGDGQLLRVRRQPPVETICAVRVGAGKDDRGRRTNDRVHFVLRPSCFVWCRLRNPGLARPFLEFGRQEPRRLFVRCSAGCAGRGLAPFGGQSRSVHAKCPPQSARRRRRTIRDVGRDTGWLNGRAGER